MAARRTSRSNGAGTVEQALADGTTPPIPEGVVWNAWPSSLTCASKLGISHKRFQQLILTGDLQPYRALDGTVRFCPDHIQAVANALAALPEDEPAREPATIAATADHVRATTKALENAISHAEALMKLVTEPLTQVQRQQEALVERLLLRLEALESSRDDMIRSREQYLSEEAERQVIREAFTAQEERRAEMMKMVREFVPPLKRAVEWKLGGGKEATTRMKAMGDFLSSVEPAFLQGMLGTEDFLTADQREKLCVALGKEFLEKLGFDQDGNPLTKDEPPQEAEDTAAEAAKEGEHG